MEVSGFRTQPIRQLKMYTGKDDAEISVSTTNNNRKSPQAPGQTY
jgi:hypothetical protein